jgi:Lrp/AsnC family leucine-responsive transcriptional regulator
VCWHSEKNIITKSYIVLKINGVNTSLMPKETEYMLDVLEVPGQKGKCTSLDKKDLALIEELKGDAKLSEQKLARKTGIPMTTVHNRLRKLRGLGVIKSYTIRLDYAKLGRPLVAYVLVKAMPGVDQKKLLERISKAPQMSEASMVAGEFDIIFKARTASIKELNDVIVRGLRMDKDISDARTMISYETIEGE